MDFLTAVLWEVLKSGSKVTLDYLRKRLSHWRLEDTKVEKIKEIANNTPEVYLKSEGMLKEYLKMDKELQNILESMRNSNTSITQNIIGNSGVAINAQENNGDVNFYSNTVEPRKTLNADFKIAEQFSKYSPIQILSSFSKTRDRCSIKTVNGKSYVFGNVYIPQMIKGLPGCQFTMMLFSFSPAENWVNFCRDGYFLYFDLELSNIIQVQFQVKNSNSKQFLDFPLKSGEFCIKLSELARENSWQDISEICFTVFADDEYILGENGYIRVCELMLKK